MILVKTDENAITHVRLDGNGKIITAEICATIDAFSNKASKTFGVPKSKAYEIILTEIAEALAKSLEKKSRR